MRIGLPAAVDPTVSFQVAEAAVRAIRRLRRRLEPDWARDDDHGRRERLITIGSEPSDAVGAAAGDVLSVEFRERLYGCRVTLIQPGRARSRYRGGLPYFGGWVL
jgi:hypothetical protein